MKKQITILGAGESGVGAAILAQQQGYQVFVSDLGKISEHYKKELRTKGIDFEENKHTRKHIFNGSEIIKSPGIPDKVTLIKDARKAGIPVISDIEFASRYTSAKIIGITGSNGKTTTTNLAYHLLKKAGYNVAVGGNIGYSFARLVAEHKYDYFVLELSSFQLDGIEKFRPNVSILLNITPDHLDRYEYKFDNYVDSKFRIIKNQKAQDLFIYNGLDKSIQAKMNHKKIKIQKVAIENDFYQNGKLKYNSRVFFDLKKCSLKGEHNRFNMMCAITAVRSFGMKIQDIQKGLNSFKNAPHRLELCGSKKGVEWINDSKATNVDSVYYALKAMEKPCIWIVGGTDKGNDYRPLEKLVTEKVKAIICLGLDNSKILEFFSPIIKTIEETKSAKEAVSRASVYAEKGDTVLLSPACASFDLFKNYIDRGDQFKAAVQKHLMKK